MTMAREGSTRFEETHRAPTTDAQEKNDPSLSYGRPFAPTGLLAEAVTTILRDVVRQELSYFFDARLNPIIQSRDISKRLPAVDTFISTAVAAQRAAVTAPTVREWVKSGKLTGHRAGRLIRIKVSELELFLASGGSANVVDLDAEARRILGGARRR